LPTAGVVAPIGVPSIVPPLMSIFEKVEPDDVISPVTLPVRFPVTSPVKAPSKPFADLTFSLKSQVSVESVHTIVLSVVPLRVIPPPSAVVSVGVVTEPSSRFLSSTDNVAELTVVVVP